ncbi:hypothetical protein ACG74X_08760 [Marivita sp. S0852]
MAVTLQRRARARRRSGAGGIGEIPQPRLNDKFFQGVTVQAIAKPGWTIPATLRDICHHVDRAKRAAKTMSVTYIPKEIAPWRFVTVLCPFFKRGATIHVVQTADGFYGK